MNDLVLGIVAGILVVFALVTSMVLPRLRPDFPGRRTGLLLAVTILLVAGMLVAVEALGESHEFHAEGSETVGTEPNAPTTTGETETAPTGETATGETGETGETGGAPPGDPAAGQEVFAAAGCGSCHTLAAANASGTIGPSLDETLPGASPEEIRTQIVDPNSQITQGYGPGIMPDNFGEELSEAELANLVVFLAREASG